MKKLYLSVAALLVSTVNLLAATPSQPEINKEKGILLMPASAERALYAFDPKFKSWHVHDYNPIIVGDGFLTDPNSLQFALLLDVNNDEVLDIVIDGHNDKESVLLGIVSEKKGYKVSLIRKYKYVDPKTIKSQFDGRESIGLPYEIRASVDNPETVDRVEAFSLVYSQESDENGEAMGDGGFTEYSYTNGEFVENVPIPL